MICFETNCSQRLAIPNSLTNSQIISASESLDIIPTRACSQSPPWVLPQSARLATLAGKLEQWTEAQVNPSSSLRPFPHQILFHERQASARVLRATPVLTRAVDGYRAALYVFPQTENISWAAESEGLAEQRAKLRAVCWRRAPSRWHSHTGILSGVQGARTTNTEPS